MAERQGVEIDFCPKCRGVWLDRGELDKILAREAALQAPAPGRDERPRHDRDDRRRYDDDDDDRYGRRKKSFWTEIFD
jgi:hypothetical protein